MSVKSENVKEETTKSKCHLCLKEFGNFELEVHLIDYHKEIDSKKWILEVEEKCEFCDLVLSNTNITAHLENSHKDALQFKCDLCDKSFYKEEILKSHLTNEHHEHKLKDFRCDICEKNLKN